MFVLYIPEMETKAVTDSICKVCRNTGGLRETTLVLFTMNKTAVNINIYT